MGPDLGHELVRKLIDELAGFIRLLARPAVRGHMRCHPHNAPKYLYPAVGGNVGKLNRPQRRDLLRRSRRKCRFHWQPERGLWPQQAQLGGAILGPAVVSSLGGFIRR
jgi:hypothetical protein